MAASLVQADVLTWLRERQWLVQNGHIPKAHAVLCDPPYFLGSIGKRFGRPDAAPAQFGADGAFERVSRGFMGQTWDGFESPWHFQAWVTDWATLLLDFVYPGALLMAFGGPRTYHRLAAGLEDAGWDVLDCLLYCFGSGFPKNHNLGKAIDRQSGAARRVVGRATNGSGGFQIKLSNHSRGDTGVGTWDGKHREYDLTAAATDDAADWEGYGSALKPAYEPIVLARAPRGSFTYAQLAQQFGTGALNIDGGRIGSPHRYKSMGVVGAGRERAINVFDRGDGKTPDGRNYAAVIERQRRYRENATEITADGRWPANLLLDDEAARQIDAQSGERSSGAGIIQRAGETSRALEGRTDRPAVIPAGQGYGDSGGASRFFYTAKANAFERSAGLDAFTPVAVNDGRLTAIDNAYQRGDTLRRCTHPTMKPIQLTEYLARLLLPPAHIGTRRLLIPFAGVASEMIGAQLAGWDEMTGIEREAGYVEQGRARLAWWGQFNNYEAAKSAYAGARRDEAHVQAGQLSLFEETGT